MSIRVMTAVWDIDLPDSQKIVLLALADCANDDGLCWPSMAALTRKCSKSERTVQGVIKDLVESGHLTRHERPGKGCIYTVHPRTPAAAAPRKDCPPQGTTDTPAAAADKPSRTVNNGLSNDKPKRARAKPPIIEIPDWMPAEPWNGYLEMRRKIGKTPTPRAIELMIGKLDGWRRCGHDPGKILDESTERNWTGLFEPKENRNGSGNQNFQRSGGGSIDRRSSLTRAIEEGLERLGG